MKVLAVVPNYPPHSRVGAWITTHSYLRHLATLGHDVQVFAEWNDLHEYALDGLHVSTMLRGRSHALELADTADVVVSHLGSSGLAAEAAERAGIPHVRMAHGHSTEPAVGDLIVFNSESLRQMTEHDCPSIVCRPPVDRAEHETTPGDRATIVNCSADKGVMTAWRAAELLPDVPFLAVQGHYGEQIRPRALNFEHLPVQGDMRAVWSRTRVLLMPSQFETYGLVAIEAAMSGIPTIAHPTPGLVESLGDAGIFVDRDDTEGWAREIERLQNPDEWATASKRAAALAADRDPADDLNRFTAAIKALTRKAVAA